MNHDLGVGTQTTQTINHRPDPENQANHAHNLVNSGTLGLFRNIRLILTTQTKPGPEKFF